LGLRDRGIARGTFDESTTIFLLGHRAGDGLGRLRSNRCDGNGSFAPRGKGMTWLIYALVLSGCLSLTLSVLSVASTMDADKKVHAAAFGLVAGTLTLLVAAAVASPERLAWRAVFVGIVLLVTTPVAAQALLRLSRHSLLEREAN